MTMRTIKPSVGEPTVSLAKIRSAVINALDAESVDACAAAPMTVAMKNKGDLVGKIAKDAGITKVQAEAAFKSLVGVITPSSRKGQKVVIRGRGPGRPKSLAAKRARHTVVKGGASARGTRITTRRSRPSATDIRAALREPSVISR
jgi:hypothetical protein